MEDISMKHISLLQIGWIFILVVARTSAATFTVTSVEDSGPGTLRQAILEINGSSGSHELLFNIPGDGVQTIKPFTPLPEISQTVIVDGYSQPGSSPNTLTDGNNAVLLIRLDGSMLTGIDAFSAGLTFTAPNNRVRGLMILGFGTGIELQASSFNIISGNWIGLDADGNGKGNATYGINVTCPVYSQSVSNLIGGIDPGDRNIISANGTGIFFFPDTASHNTVQGNFIGTDATGTKARGNTFGCVVVQSASDIVIGGSQPGARNILSASTGAGGAGVEVIGGLNVIIQGNHIGTDISGSLNLGNFDSGISANGAEGLIVGGTAPEEGNLISCNRRSGIFLLGSGHSVVQGNAIGTDASGLIQIGNDESGIFIMGGGTNLVGGDVPGAANMIRFNNGPGIQVQSGDKNTISCNLIAINGMAIELGFDGQTPNDAGDGDKGPNQLQNYPVLTSAESSYGMIEIQGNLNSSSQTSFRLEFFATPFNSHEGLHLPVLYLGATQVNTDANGDAAFDVKWTGSIPVGYGINATATDSVGNTSEYSRAVTPNLGPASLSLSLNITSQSPVIQWPVNASGFNLEVTESLSPPVIWRTVATGIKNDGVWMSYILPAGSSNQAQFYRLTR
jgi:titin